MPQEWKHRVLIESRRKKTSSKDSSSVVRSNDTSHATRFKPIFGMLKHCLHRYIAICGRSKMTDESYGFVLRSLIPAIYFSRASCHIVIPVRRDKQRALHFTEKVGFPGDTLDHIRIYFRDEQRIRTNKLSLKRGKALQLFRVSGRYLSNLLSAHFVSFQ